MPERMKITEDLFVGPQPTEDDLKQLAAEGFATVVNLRDYDEEDQPLSPGDEGVRVRELGMDYLSIPVSKEDFSEHQVDDFRTKCELMDKPVFVHCKSGKRSGAFAMMDVAARRGWSGKETLEKARQMGFACDVPELKQFVKEYVDHHNGRKR